MRGPRTTMAVIQDPAPCTFGLDPTGVSFSGTTGSDFVNVSGLLGCAWTAVSNDAWINVDAGAAGNGDGIVLYSVNANPGGTVSSGTLTIGGQTFTVNSPVEKSTTYFYRVMACSSAGCSTPSAEVSVTRPAMSVFVGETR